MLYFNFTENFRIKKSKNYSRKLILILFVLAVTASAFPQTKSGSTNPSVDTVSKTIIPAIIPDELKRPEEIKIKEKQEGGSSSYYVKRVYERSSNKSEGGLGDYIIVEVDFLQMLLKEKTVKNKNIILFINGLPIKGNYPVILKDSVNNESRLEFYLSRSNMSKESWDLLLRRPDIEERSDKSVRVSVGFEDENEISAKDNNFSIIVFKPKTLYIFLIGIILLLGFTIYLGSKTTMLKEPAMLKENFSNRPYSLALTQMAFWSFLIIASYLALFIVTTEFPPITGSVLTLIGISSGTALGSVLINYNKYSEAQVKDNKINAEKNVLRLRIEEIDELLSQKTLPVNSVELQNEREVKKLRYYELAQTQSFIPSEISQTSKGFWKDLLSDSNGISLYRFQIAVWTLVIGFIFIINVYDNLSMPQFDNTLLALMGISSGTYLGFKIPEKLQ